MFAKVRCKDYRGSFSRDTYIDDAATVDDAENAPEQKDDEQSNGALTLSGRDSLDEHQVQTERRQNNHRVEYLHKHRRF